MATADAPKTFEIDAAKLRDEWLSRLNDLIERVQWWVEEVGWSTRKIEKRMQDSQIGKYHAPALLLQIETDRVLLDPIDRTAQGVDGVVDLYLMPAYDDIASLYYCDGAWKLQYAFSGSSSLGAPQNVDSQPLSKETLQQVLAEMRKHAGSTV